MYNIVL